MLKLLDQSVIVEVHANRYIKQKWGGKSPLKNNAQKMISFLALTYPKPPLKI